LLIIFFICFTSAETKMKDTQEMIFVFINVYSSSGVSITH